MSEENVEIVRRAFQYLVSGRGGSEVLASFDPNVVMKPVETGETYGVNAIRDNFERWQSTFDELEVTVEEMIDAGDRVVHSAHWRGRGRGSGIKVDARYHEVYKLRDGKIIRVDEYTERADALEAAGLTEQAMSQENVEVVLQGIEALNRRDVDAFVALVSPDVEWEDSVFWSEHARIYTGEAELREWFNQVILEPWESVHFEVEEITEAGDDRVFFGGLLTTRGKGSGVETQVRGWSVVWITNGKTTRRQVFLDRADALEAAGLEE